MAEAAIHAENLGASLDNGRIGRLSDRVRRSPASTTAATASAATLCASLTLGGGSCRPRILRGSRCGRLRSERECSSGRHKHQQNASSSVFVQQKCTSELVKISESGLYHDCGRIEARICGATKNKSRARRNTERGF